MYLLYFRIKHIPMLQRLFVFTNLLQKNADIINNIIVKKGVVIVAYLKAVRTEVIYSFIDLTLEWKT